MIRTVLRTLNRSSIIHRTRFLFSDKITSQSDKTALAKFEWENHRQMMENQSRNVMKNYDIILPGVFVRNDIAVELDLWEARTKRHRHAKLKRLRRKKHKRTIITNN